MHYNKGRQIDKWTKTEMCIDKDIEIDMCIRIRIFRHKDI